MNKNKETELKELVSHEDVTTHSISLLKFLVFVLVIISIGNFIRSYHNEAALEKTTKAAQTAENVGNKAQQISIESRDASIQTFNELHLILEELELHDTNQPKLNNQAINDALLTVTRIENVICNGRCPDPEN